MGFVPNELGEFDWRIEDIQIAVIDHPLFGVSVTAMHMNGRSCGVCDLDGRVSAPVRNDRSFLQADFCPGPRSGNDHSFQRAASRGRVGPLSNNVIA